MYTIFLYLTPISLSVAYNISTGNQHNSYQPIRPVGIIQYNIRMVSPKEEG